MGRHDGKLITVLITGLDVIVTRDPFMLNTCIVYFHNFYEPVGDEYKPFALTRCTQGSQEDAWSQTLALNKLVFTLIHEVCFGVCEFGLDFSSMR